jgi:UDP-glucose 4-epimerase
MKVVVTGAAGYLADRMLPELRRRYDLTLLDIQSKNRRGEAVDGVIEVDLLQRDRDEFRQHFAGADAVLHCGFVRKSGDEAAYWGEVDNINMAYNVYKVCVEEGVKRAVVLSSNHAADYYEQLIWSDRMEMVTPNMLPLSDNYYGWAKSAYELLGFVFATGGEGDPRLEMVQLRIGAPRETDIDNLEGVDRNTLHRSLGAYLSVRDQVQLVVKSLETEDVADENGVPFQIFYGISGNSHRFWSLANARRVIDYQPEDDSQIRFAAQVSKYIQG